MEETLNIIEKMISQHRTLQKDLSVAFELSNIEKPDSVSINDYLSKFQIDIVEHLHLENGTFYPKLLAKMRKYGMDISKTEDFINQMVEIGNTINLFLEKYNDISKIENQTKDFNKELQDIIFTLNLRIESEESGVYIYWDLYK